MVHLHKHKKTRRRLFLTGLLIITVLFSLYHLYLLNYFEAMSRRERHVIRFAAILLVYTTGLLLLKSLYPAWLVRIWHLLYGITGIILLAIGGYYWCFGEMTPQFHDIAISLTEFSLSPAPFVIMAIINKSLSGSLNPHLKANEPEQQTQKDQVHHIQT